MRKMYAAIAGAVVVALVATLAVLGISRESGYAIEDAGYTYAADGSITPVSAGARYDVQQRRPVLVQHKQVTELDAAKLIRVSDGSVRLLNSSVAITSPQTVFDLVAKTLLTRDGLDAYTAASAVLADQQSVPAGSLVKTADRRYLVLDTGTIEHGEGESVEQIGSLGSEALIALDSSGTVTFYDGESVTQQFSDRLRVVLDGSGYIFDLSREILIDPATGAELELGRVLVEFDDEPTAGSVDRDPTAEPTTEPTEDPTAEPTEQPTAESTGSAGSTESTQPAASTGTGTAPVPGSNEPTDPSESTDPSEPVELPELPELIDGRTQMPTVLLTAVAPVSTIEASLSVVDASLALRSLQVQVLDRAGSVLATADVDPTSGQHTWTSGTLTPGESYVVQAVGSYVDGTGVERQAVFGTVPVTVGTLELTSSTVEVGSTSAIIHLQATAHGDALTELVLRYRLNAGGSPALGTVVVPHADLAGGGTAVVTLTGLDPQTSYLVEVETARAGGVDLATGWNTVLSTRATAVTATGVQASYDSGSQQFTLALDGLNDPDRTITQVRYLAFTADDWSANGLSAGIKASLVVGAERAALTSTLALPASMGQGTYVWVAVVTSHDGVDDQQLEVPPLGTLDVTAKQGPTALFAEDRIGADAMSIRYVINDQDGTIVLDGSTHPVATLYRVDATGQITGAAVAQVDLLTADQLTSGVLAFDGLERLTDYRVVLSASYDLGDGVQADQVIGTSEIVTTTDVDPVQVTFDVPDTALVTTTDARIGFQLSDEGSTLTAAQLLVTRVSTGEVLHTLDIDTLLSGAITPDWSSLDLTGLAPNTRYSLSVVNAVDSGGNTVPVTGTGELRTRKRAPEATGVSVLADVAAATVTARLQNGAAAITDVDTAVTSVVYQLIDADDPSATPIAERSVAASGSQISFDLLSTPGAGRGRTYIVRAILQWSDNYVPHSAVFDSVPVDVEKSGPLADLTYLSRDASGLTVKVTVTDPDETVVDAPVLDVNGARTVLAVGTQTVTVPVDSGALAVSVLADYRVLASDPITAGAVLQTSTVQPLGLTAAVPSAEVVWAGGRQVRVTPSAAADLAALTLDTRTAVTSVGAAAPDWTGTGHGAGTYAATSFAVPQGNLVMGADHQLGVSVTARYRQNHLGYDGLTGATVYLATADGSALVGSVDGRLAIGPEGTAYTVQSATLGDNGDVNGLELVNTMTGRYVGYGTYLNDDSASASSLRLVKLGNGSHVLSVNGRYVALKPTGSDLVTTIALATPVFVYSTAEAVGHSEQPLPLPVLTAPTVVAANLQVRDTSVLIDVAGSDPDSTMLRDAQHAAELWVSIYDTATMTLVRTVQVPALSATGVTLSGLVGGVDYTLRVHGSYNLGDGSGDVDHIWFADSITTAKSLPSLITGPTLTWIQGCGTDGRSVTTVVGWDDPSEVLTGIRYDWYVRTSAFDGVDLTNTAQLAAAITASGQSPAYSYDAGLATRAAMPMFDGSSQHYYAGVTYVIAVSMETNLPDAPEYLVSGRSLAITGPAAATGNISVDPIGQTSASATFTVSDTGYYLTCAAPMNFTYTLTDVDTGELAESGSFTVARTSSGPPALNFTNLDPGTNYTLVIASAAHDLRQDGLRSWSVTKTFATADQYVTTSRPTLSITGDSGAAKAAHVHKGAADSITVARFDLYWVDLDGDRPDTVVASQTATVPADGGTAQTDFDLSGLPTGGYYVKLVLTYLVDGTEHTMTTDASVAWPYTSSSAAMAARSFGGTLWLTGDDIADGEVEVVTTDVLGTLVSSTTAVASDGSVMVSAPTGVREVTVQVTDSEGTVSEITGVALTAGFDLGSGSLPGTTMGASL